MKIGVPTAIKKREHETKPEKTSKKFPITLRVTVK